MMYRLRAEEDVFELNPELRAIPEFAKLTDRQMKLVILVADKKSPLRKLAGKEKREQAWKAVGGPMEGPRLDKNGRNFVLGQVEGIEKGIAKYKELDFDENTAKLSVIRDVIQRNYDYGKNLDAKADTYGKDLERANKLIKELPELEESRQKLEALFDIKEAPVEIQTFTSADIPQDVLESEQPMSTIDMLMAQRKKDGN